MTPRDHARKFYGAQWNDVLDDYVSRHYVYASPTSICLAKPDGDSWFIEYMSGDMGEAFCKLPFWLPKITFKRRGRVRTYWMASLINKLLADGDFDVKGSVNDSIQDGFADSLLRRRGWRQDTESASSTRTFDSGGKPCQIEDSGQAA